MNPFQRETSMLPMPVADLMAVGDELARTGKRVKVLWQTDDTLAFVARGREYRSEFHLDPSDEVMFMIKGEMKLHYRFPDGQGGHSGPQAGRSRLHRGKRTAFTALPA